VNTVRGWISVLKSLRFIHYRISSADLHPMSSMLVTFGFGSSEQLLRGTFLLAHSCMRTKSYVLKSIKPV